MIEINTQQANPIFAKYWHRRASINQEQAARAYRIAQHAMSGAERWPDRKTYWLTSAIYHQNLQAEYHAEACRCMQYLMKAMNGSRSVIN